MEKLPRRLASYMVDHADYLIACVWHPASNTRDLMEYAQKKGIVTTNLGKSRRELLFHGLIKD